MLRKYHVSHLQDARKAVELLKLMGDMEGVHSVSLTEDLAVLDIDAEEELIGPIMERTVNLCRRISQDCELSYMFFQTKPKATL
ncbi:MAG TPA: hypothetical protein H9717_12225 [Candidatus Eisenbergiella merdipullorum]|uniref:Uncharacterized protein n=1 Tax=Candidatus Eisenbergiella merdipullorum TaxID=2838553 RepID=A0A9D2I974_9FIRM|nr:hypothetical protein [Candidatus Eisenbergiella merdipullorum]